MSRYLRTVARETRTKLRPPSGLRLAPRAPAIFDEVHEERLVDPAPTVRDVPRFVQTPAAEPAVATHKPPEVPPPSGQEQRPDAPSEERRPAAEPAVPQPVPILRFETREQPAIPIMQNAAKPRQTDPAAAPLAAARSEARLAAPTQPAVARSETRPAAPAPPRKERSSEIFEATVHSESYVVEEERPTAKEVKESRTAEFAIPETVRNWLRPQTERPAPAVKPAQTAIAPAPQPPRTAPQPSIEVTIGKIEVTIESEPQPPLRITPHPASTPRKSTPPPLAGRLARQYLDR